MDFAARTPVPGAADDMDLLNFPREVSNAQQQSPKRTRWDFQVPPTSPPKISLEQLTAALAPLTDGVAQMRQRMTELENQMACKVDKTLDLVQILDERQRDQGARLEEVQRTVKEHSQRDKAREASIQDILKRIDVLEEGQSSSRAWQQHPFLGEQGGGARAPAVVFGGWSLDLDEDEVLLKAKRVVKDAGLDIDMTGAFMPDKNKGFLIIPMNPKDDEDRLQLQRRTIQIVETVRNAALPGGGVDRSGRPAKLWLAISEPPKQRRRTRQLSKTKRCVLEVAEKRGVTLQLRADYKTGYLLLDHKKVAGIGSPPAGSHMATSDHGWLDTKAVAEATGETRKVIEDTWMELVEAIS